MEQACFPIMITQGATFELQVAWQDSNGVGINMSGWTLKADLYNRLGTQKLASFSLPWVNQASGIFNLTMASSVTSGITEHGQYDIFATDPSGKVYCPLEGPVTINPSLSFLP